MTFEPEPADLPAILLIAPNGRATLLRNCPERLLYEVEDRTEAAQARGCWPWGAVCQRLPNGNLEAHDLSCMAEIRTFHKIRPGRLIDDPEGYGRPNAKGEPDPFLLADRASAPVASPYER